MDDRITYDELKDLVIYENGKLFWNPKRHVFMSRATGLVGGSAKTHTVKIKGKHYTKTHLIFFLHYKRWPIALKHKDGNRLNRKIENLEELFEGPTKYCSHHQDKLE